MAKVSVSMSLTVNRNLSSVEFAKMEAEIRDVDMDADVEAQLQNYDEAMEAICNRLRDTLKKVVH